MEIKNLKKVAIRIKKAIKNKENIILYGDADIDGITSVIILEETIKNLGGMVGQIYFSDREKDGSGIHRKGLSELEKKTSSLLIVLDCGITNFKETILAKKLGFELIIIDHHEVLGKIPKADIVVDPKQEGDKYPFKEFSNGGITYKLSKILLGKEKSKGLDETFLELAALSTIADMMPQKEDNKILIEKGLKSLHNTYRPFFRIFLDDGEAEGRSIQEIVQKIVFALNSGQKKENSHEIYSALTCPDIKEAEQIAETLLDRSYSNQIKIKQVRDEIENLVSKKTHYGVIFEGDQSWPFLSLGSAASRISEDYKIPVFLFKKGKNESRGSVRAPHGFNVVKIMTSCAKFLETYGGHPPAGGFKIKNENLEKFRECLIKSLQK
ncbi:MAG: DHH family phosphoesterase [Patescibacteria group bacterium]|nr:DHH family phosphoesterase [Patescibacteria group bacterium]